jgi:outer membrane protein OmpA-like peptidoglycan-associated protein
MWWRQLALHAGQHAAACLHIAGHTGRGGSDEANESLSFRRAFVVRTQLVERASHVAPTTRVSGYGSKQMLVGSGTNDANDAIDRRVELVVGDC